LSIRPPGAAAEQVRVPHAFHAGDTILASLREEPVVTQPAFSSIMSSLDAQLIVVTAADGGERAGCLVGFHAQSSIDPDRYCVWLSKANHTYRVALRATHLGIHFLGEADLSLAVRFGTLTGDTVDKFDGLGVQKGPGGVPLLKQCPNRLAVRRVALLDEGGDHVCVTTEPVAVRTGGPFKPLWLSHAGDLQPAHGNEERNRPPTERAATPIRRRSRRPHR
jgi:flavin reductase (DIM6/NTAB) family NADH-FMN oxidoreductase RutF